MVNLKYLPKKLIFSWLAQETIDSKRVKNEKYLTKDESAFMISYPLVI
jgi:hypothetical protein